MSKSQSYINSCKCWQCAKATRLTTDQSSPVKCFDVIRVEFESTVTWVACLDIFTQPETAQGHVEMSSQKKTVYSGAILVGQTGLTRQIAHHLLVPTERQLVFTKLTSINAQKTTVCVESRWWRCRTLAIMSFMTVSRLNASSLCTHRLVFRLLSDTADQQLPRNSHLLHVTVSSKLKSSIHNSY